MKLKRTKTTTKRTLLTIANRYAPPQCKADVEIKEQHADAEFANPAAVLHFRKKE
jgi:hypothetical protein